MSLRVAYGRVLGGVALGLFAEISIEGRDLEEAIGSFQIAIGAFPGRGLFSLTWLGNPSWLIPGHFWREKWTALSGPLAWWC